MGVPSATALISVRVQSRSFERKIVSTCLEQQYANTSLWVPRAIHVVNRPCSYSQTTSLDSPQTIHFGVFRNAITSQGILPTDRTSATGLTQCISETDNKLIAMRLYLCIGDIAYAGSAGLPCRKIQSVNSYDAEDKTQTTYEDQRVSTVDPAPHSESKSGVVRVCTKHQLVRRGTNMS